MEITGRITGDAQIKKTKDNRELIAFTLVINDRYKAGGELKNEATFFNCAYWLSTAIAEHLRKGTIVTLSGRVGLNAYKGKDGEYYAHLTFHANSVKIIAKGNTAFAHAPEATPQAKDDLPF